MAQQQRLPLVNSDDGIWGEVLNQFISKEHYNGDTDLNQATSENGGHQHVTLQPGNTVAGTAPLKFADGNLLDTLEVGAIEFSGNKFYLTQVTNTTNRRTVAVYDDTTGADGDLYYRDANGNLLRLAIGSQNDILTVNGSNHPSWVANTRMTLQQTMAISSLRI